MDTRFPILLLLILGKLYQMALHIVQLRSAGNPIPNNVADVYDGETYQTWRRYSAEKCRLGILRTGISFAISLTLLVSNAYAAFASLFPAGIYWQLLAVIVLEMVAELIFSVALDYWDTFVIEQKYGFNRSTKKTFVMDQVRSLILAFGLTMGIVCLLASLHQAMGDWIIVLFAGVMFCFTLLASFLYPLFSRLGNKFVPLEEGQLRTELMALLTKHGYQVKAIEVMDASRRTTKLNAYFTGFGKMKTIVLYDNLINAMSTQEICAVFAHELGHGLHKDVLKRQLLNIGNLLLMAVVVWLAVRNPGMHMDFGFPEVNYGFAYILLGIGLGLVQPLTGIVMNAHSRAAEYRADRQAVQEGYGSAMVTALKKLARENFSHLAPSALFVILEYSHPPLHRRIEEVEKSAAGK